MHKLITTAMGLALVGMSQNVSAAVASDVNTAPNVIIILADDLGLPDVSAYGYNKAQTPNLERLAQAGTLFKNGYVAASVCAVSRAALLTGISPQKFGFSYNLDKKRDADKGLQLSQTTLANYLKNTGYNTYAIGKWHLGWAEKYYPMNRGFDDFYGFMSGQTLYASEATPGIITTHTKFDKQKPVSFEQRGNGGEIISGANRTLVNDNSVYTTDDFTNRAVQYINAQREEKSPFFIYLAYNAPHWPLQVPEKYYNKFPEIQDPVRRTYVAMINNLDDNIGRILDKLAETGQEENTMVVFLSDNGCSGRYGVCDCSSPLGAGKFTYVQGGINIPFIIKWPGKIAAKHISHVPVSSLDITPTVLRAARQEISDKHFDGIDLSDMLHHEATWQERKLYFGQSPVYAMVEGNWKLWVSEDQQRAELYNIADDLAQQKDLSQTHSKQKSSMLHDLENWKKTLVKADWPLHFTNNNWQVCGKETQLVY